MSEGVNFIISKKDLSDMVNESNRFLFHIVLIQILTNLIDGKKELFGFSIIKTILITVIAVIIYHVFFKKIIQENS